MDWNDVFFNPLRDFFSSIMQYLPRIVGALVLLLVGWIVAKVLKSVTRKLVRAAGVDKRFAKESVAQERYPVAEGTATAVWWIVWILFILAILQVLGLEGVITSITVLFTKIFAAIPNIIAALIVLVIFYFIGRFLAGLVTKLLNKIRFNELPVKMGLTKQTTEGAASPASIVGYIVLVIIMLFGIMMAADLLGFAIVNDLIAGLTRFLAQVILGVIIIGVGIFVANLVASILRTGGRSQAMISMVRIFIIILSVAIGLRAMGFANDIILLIFGLILGAIAVAVAVAFGLGGRKAAGELLDRWTKRGEK